MKNFKKCTALCLALATLLLTITGCSKKGVETAMTLGDYQMSAGTYLSYVINSYAAGKNKVEDKDKDVFKQKIEDKDAAEYMKEEAVKSAKYHMVVEKLFTDKKLEFGEQDTQYAEYMLKYYWENGEKYYTQNGIGYESLKKNIYNQSKAEVLFQDIYNEDKGEKKVTKKEKQAYFNKNYDKMSYTILPLTLTSGEKVTEDKQKEVEDMAKEMVKKANDKGDFKKLADTYVEKATTTVGNTYNKENATNVSEEFIDKTGKNTTTFSDDVKKELDSLKEGQATYKVEDKRILVFKKEKKTDSDYTSKAAQVLVDMKGDEFKQYIEDQFDTIGIEVNQKAIDYYLPKKVKELKAESQ